MNIINMPRQSGRTTKLLNDALTAAKLNGVSVVVVPNIHMGTRIASELKEMDKQHSQNVIVMSFDSFVRGNRIHEIRGKRNVKIYIDDLDICLGRCAGGHGEIEYAIIEENKEVN